MAKLLRITILAALLPALGLLAGCGVKGPLERPDGAPREVAPGPDGKTPHKPFILDGLIR